jgi:HAD superfamily hydrolase (TIGR01509 family)
MNPDFKTTSVRAVVFDLDGLMFNTEELYVDVGTEVLRRRGKQMTSELLDAMMGRRPPQAIARMIEWHNLTDTVEAIMAESREIFGPILDARLQPMPGLMSLLDALDRAAIPKAVGTSSGFEFVTNVLSRFELIPRFQFLLTAEAVKSGKPHPEIYLTAAERFEIQPPQMVVLEDSENGCRAAVAAGAVAVAVPGTHSEHHCFDGAALMVSSLEDDRLWDLLGLHSK